ncbi:hypothetical protein [Actinomadura alba]|uniref:PH domain-containing protein n=1 Tax=Actinomadura alba TaxID=406431 RepID=A0ABR7LY81_9ACTN|nr:hypothetical protein [Actinomadura alba]MBC6469348.1 hypothetical protein [Actinomadura alba]
MEPADEIAGGRSWRQSLVVVVVVVGFLLTVWQAVEARRAVQAHEDWRNSRVCAAAAVPECRETVPAQVVGREKDVSGKSVHYWLRFRETSHDTATAIGDVAGGAARTYRVRVLDDDAWARAAPGDRVELVRWRGEIREVRLDPGGPRQPAVQTIRHPSRLPALPTGLAVLFGGFAAAWAWSGVTYGRKNAYGTPRGITQRGEVAWYPFVPVISLFVGSCLVGIAAALGGRTDEGQALGAVQILQVAAVAVAACVPVFTLWWLWQRRIIRRRIRKAYTAPRTPLTERTVRAVVWGDDDFHKPGYDGLLIGPKGVLASTPDPDVRVALHRLPQDLVLDRIRASRHDDPARLDPAQLVADCRTPDGRPLHIGARHADMRWIHGALQAAGQRHP